jgi:hypothetical protein
MQLHAHLGLGLVLPDARRAWLWLWLRLRPTTTPATRRHHHQCDRPQIANSALRHAARYGGDRRATRKTRSAIHWGALPICLPLTGYQQASVRGSAANAVCFTLYARLKALAKSTRRGYTKMLKKAPAETPLEVSVNAPLQGGFDPLTSSQGLSSPLLCAPACRPAHLLV